MHIFPKTVNMHFQENVTLYSRMIRTKDRAFLSNPTESLLVLLWYMQITLQSSRNAGSRNSSGRTRLEGAKNNNNQKKAPEVYREYSRNNIAQFELLAAIFRRDFSRKRFSSIAPTKRLFHLS